MFNEPKPSDWIVPAVLLVVVATVVSILQNLVPTPSSNSYLFGASMICTSGLLVICFLAALFGFVQWWLHIRAHLFYQIQEAKAITPLLRAAQAVRELTDEQAALLPRFMPDDAQAVYVDQENELEAYFNTPEGMVPWDFIEEFLLQSNSVYLMPVNSTNDKTSKRVYCQAMTNVCIRKNWAVPAVGPHAAMWKDSGREKASKFFHIQLRNGVGYVEPERNGVDENQ